MCVLVHASASQVRRCRWCLCLLGLRMSLDDFIAEHTDMVRSLAVGLQVELKLRVELEDLVAYAVQGLLEARERFDPSKGCECEAPLERFDRRTTVHGTGE